MKNIKDLTPIECEKIASIAFPEIKWKYVKSKESWDGFDLIEQGYSELTTRFIFQINFDTSVEKKLESRFSFYDDLNQFPLESQQLLDIINYIESL